jgi:hypothetical protein
MSTQRIEQGSMATNQRSRMVTIRKGKKTALQEEQQARVEAVRVAKARITRRNSLRKQREAQKL